MPNWCINMLRSEDSDVIEFGVRGIQKRSVDFNMICPLPEESNDWYEERFTKWGTNRNGSYCGDRHSEDGSVTIYFETAWCPPQVWFSSLCKLFPDKVIEMYSAEASNGISCLSRNNNGDVEFIEIDYRENPVGYDDDEEYYDEENYNEENTDLPFDTSIPYSRVDFSLDNHPAFLEAPNDEHNLMVVEEVVGEVQF